jgi:predicted dehydrogenase
MREKLNWGVIGTGGIASDFAEALERSERCRIVNVVGSSLPKARAFAERFGIPSAAPTLGDFLGDAAVDAVYIATPHPAHEAQALASIEAGKAVLCEKPLTCDAASGARVIEAAARRGVFLMEAFMYRCHPLTRDLVTRLQDGVIGPLRHLRADFAFRVPRNPSGRLFDIALAGGGILDVGGYPISLARLLAGIVERRPFAEPVKVDAIGVIGPTGVDELATALLTFGSGFTAAVTSGVYHDAGTTAVIFGEDGKIVIADPWIPGSERHGLETGYTILRDRQKPENVAIRTAKGTYAIEAELVADTLPGKEAAWPAMTWADSLGNMQALDAWRAALLRGAGGVGASRNL